VREAGVNENKEKESLPKRRKIIARGYGVTVQKILIFYLSSPPLRLDGYHSSSAIGRLHVPVLGPDKIP
jgi:hypothetical protein